MKEKEPLMRGDWVNLDFGFNDKKPLKILRLHQHFIDTISENGTEFNSIPYSMLEGIPLSIEFFKINGFDIVKDGDCDSFTIWKQKDDEDGNEIFDITIYYYEEEAPGEFNIRIRNKGELRKWIRYIHEFQQIFRICGFEDDLIFKKKD